MELVLIGSCKGDYDPAPPSKINWIRDAEAFINDKNKGYYAIWFSYPIPERFQSIMNQKLYQRENNKGEENTIKLYTYDSGKIKHLFFCCSYETRRGNNGIKSPWPKYTTPEWIDVKRAGSTNNKICKTWLPLNRMVPQAKTLNDFRDGKGNPIDPCCMRNQFAYAYEI
jgi:hypothetical protein